MRYRVIALSGFMCFRGFPFSQWSDRKNRVSRVLWLRDHGCNNRDVKLLLPEYHHFHRRVTEQTAVTAPFNNIVPSNNNRDTGGLHHVHVYWVIATQGLPHSTNVETSMLQWLHCEFSLICSNVIHPACSSELVSTLWFILAAFSTF